MTTTIAPPATHGVELTFETLEPASRFTAPLRVLAGEETLMRVVSGSVGLAVGGHTRLLVLEDEARIPAGTPHRLWNAGRGRARVVRELRPVA